MERKFRELEIKFREFFEADTNYVMVRSPGRVNLIGEHTDYNNGFVLPAAVNLEIFGIARKRKDNIIRVFSIDFNELKEFSLEKHFVKSDDWGDYILGVASELKKKYVLRNGFDVVYKSNLPVGSGLSSSAAFELINLKLLTFFNDIKLSPKDSAILCQEAENNFVGVNCGIMDQFSIALGEEDSALFLDTLTLDYDIIPLNLRDYKIVIGNTKKPRQLIDSDYNKRRLECQTAVKILKNNEVINSLRDVDLEMLNKYRKKLSNTIYKRALHIITENQRVLDSVKALQEKDLKKFGNLMISSHKSLQELYEVSCKELDIMVDEALKIPGVLGSRMTGAGFGGCTVNLVHKDNINLFIEKVGDNYKRKTNYTPEFYVAQAVKGTEILTQEEAG